MTNKIPLNRKVFNVSIMTQRFRERAVVLSFERVYLGLFWPHPEVRCVRAPYHTVSNRRARLFVHLCAIKLSLSVEHNRASHPSDDQSLLACAHNFISLRL